MGGATGYATSLEGKQAKVASVKDLLSRSEMVFTVPASSLTVQKTQGLRNSLPEGTTMTVVKNKLMARALADTEYECASSLLKGANMWFFIEEDISATLKAYNGYLKDNGLKESHGILGGAIDGGVVDPAQVAAIGNLPSKQELYAKIAGGIKAVPTKLARVVKAPGAKMARAIKLAVADEDKE
jgi:large subunit ribosomal protein L10